MLLNVNKYLLTLSKPILSKYIYLVLANFFFSVHSYKKGNMLGSVGCRKNIYKDMKTDVFVYERVRYNNLQDSSSWENQRCVIRR